MHIHNSEFKNQLHVWLVYLPHKNLFVMETTAAIPSMVALYPTSKSNGTKEREEVLNK